MADNNQDKDQRTHDATPQRIRKAREEGQLGFSAEFVGGVILAVGTLIASTYGSWFFESLCATISNRLTEFEDVILDPRRMVAAIGSDARVVGVACIAFIVPIGIVATMSGLLQTGFNISLKPLELKWSKLSVIAGFGRIFSGKSAVRGILSILKATMIVSIVYWIARSKMEEIALTGFGSFAELMFALGEILLYTSIAISASMLIVGLIDLSYQKWKHLQDLRMSMQDLKDEHKDAEGDPQMRARLKRLQAEMSRKSMLSAVPDADVVITNPTHFAVAIKYDRETMGAPIVVAKGGDFLAKKIIQIAKENGVAVVERKPVARFLYFNVDIDSQIPFELYQAVAEVLNFVNGLRTR